MFNPDTGFNPRAREGRDEEYKPLIAEVRVSIHAPAKGATRRIARLRGLPKGFNPRAREGRDLRCALPSSALSAVSIHAPAKGATWGAGSAPCPKVVSIHAPAKGATARSLWPAARIPSFNPRAREGRDLYQSLRPATFKCFNPRAREGRDHAASFHR